MPDKQRNFLSYGRQLVGDDDIAAVAAVLKGDMLTGGQAVADFETALARQCGSKHAVACANGTAALHLAALALGIGPGDHVVVPAVTFLATANAVRYVGAEVIFADVDAESGILTPELLNDALAAARGRRVAAVFPVWLGGQGGERAEIARIAAEHGAEVVVDACHALGTEFDEAGHDAPGRAGDCRHAAMATFSFHPVKTITMGEGGAITTGSDTLAERLNLFRNHGMTRDVTKFEAGGPGFESDGRPAPWAYEMAEPGFNYRASDIACALGASQLGKLAGFAARRRALVEQYDRALALFAPAVRPVRRLPGCRPCLHLYTVLIDFAALGLARGRAMDELARRGIGTQVHYIPVCHQPYYKHRYGPVEAPGAESYYARCLSLPLHAGMDEKDVSRVVEAVAGVFGLDPADSLAVTGGR